MDPTKTTSYRRWRNKLINKGFFKVASVRDESFQASAALESGTASGQTEPQEREIHLKLIDFQDMDETLVQKLFKELLREYRKKEVFRKKRVAELKHLIKNGLYHIPGRVVVDKWFPEEPAS